MSEEQEDKSQKTEQPTEHRLEEARKKGQLTVSKELTHWFMLFAAALVIGVVLPTALTKLSQILRSFIELSHALATDGEGLRHIIYELGWKVAVCLGLVFLFFIIAALAGTFVQTRFNISAESLKPKLEKVSIQKGLGRLFSKKTMMEFFKSVFKLIIIGSIIIMVMIPEFHNVDNLIHFSILEFAGELHDQITWLLILVVSLVTLLAGIDYAFQRYSFMEDMRMTRKEIKDEHKDMEGDPHVKSKIRQIRQDRARQNIAQSVPEATVIVTNPTHFSVALKYEMGEMGAPIVVAKGLDNVALRIREIAKENDIPLYRNPPLARMLHANIEVGEQIDEKHYEAVAKVIRYVMELKNKKNAS